MSSIISVGNKRYIDEACGRYGLAIEDEKELYERFQVENELKDFKPRWNIAPSQLNPVIYNGEKRIITRMVWGLLPSFAKDKHQNFAPINAKSETVDTLFMFKESFQFNRCAIPATYFFEPDKIHYKKPPFPWHLFKVKDQPLFAFAGIYSIWIDKETKEEIYSYALLTTEPNELVGKYHPRMPVILPEEDIDSYLDPDVVEPEQIKPLLKPYPAKNMEEWHVADAARDFKNDYPEIMKPVGK